jgi:hypothetical protein
MKEKLKVSNLLYLPTPKLRLVLVRLVSIQFNTALCIVQNRAYRVQHSTGKQNKIMMKK